MVRHDAKAVQGMATTSERKGGPEPTRRQGGIFAIRPVGSLVQDTGAEGQRLKRSVGKVDLTALGLGAIIGTGIFVVIGEGVGHAGPAVVFSFVLAGFTCLFSALCYAELASAIPVSGSAYTYAYATLGELIAWIIGWDLILEYGVSVAAVAVGWGANLNVFLRSAFGFELPAAIAAARGEPGAVINIPAVLIVLAITALLLRGAKESARVNTVMVVVKLAVLVFFIATAAAVFDADNLRPFAPAGTGGVVTAASIIFFAYIGFDAISTGSEEARNPGRDLPIAIMGALGIATLLYILVALGAVGALPANQLKESEAPLAEALEPVFPWAAALMAFGAIVSITSVILAIFYGQTRIFFAMARDGLMPRRLATVNPRTGVPVRITLAFGVFIAILAALVPLSEIVKLVNIGTLFAFLLVNVGVLVLRRTRPEMERPFRVPWVPVVPLLGVAFTIYLMADLPLSTWLRFLLWLGAGLAIYAVYGYRHSRLRHGGTYHTDS
ncbi:MAG TPA: amino acid permease [Catenuloplanes sp.]